LQSNPKTFLFLTTPYIIYTVRRQRSMLLIN